MAYTRLSFIVLTREDQLKLRLIPFLLMTFLLVSVSRRDALAQQTDPFVYERYSVLMHYETDGTGSVETTARIHVQNSTGVNRVGQLLFSYNAETEGEEIKLVRVSKADGRVIVAGPEAVQDLTAPVSQMAPVYSDMRQKHITVPSLSVGDLVEYDVLTTEVHPLIPGHFWQTVVFDLDAPCSDEQVELNVPGDRSLQIKAPDGLESTVRKQGDRTLYHWQTSFVPKPLPVSPPTATPFIDPTQALTGIVTPPPRRLMFSTFQSWQAFGSWYSGIEKDRRTITPEIRRRADEIVHGAVTDLDKAQAIYRFVSREIRYVSLSFGIGRYQPQ